MAEIALEVKDQKELSLITSALKREKELLEWEIIKTKTKLETFEKKHSMTNQQFLEKYLKGKMGDEEEIMEWAGEYQFLQKFEEKHQQLEDLIKECLKHMEA